MFYAPQGKEVEAAAAAQQEARTRRRSSRRSITEQPLTVEQRQAQEAKGAQPSFDSQHTGGKDSGYISHDVQLTLKRMVLRLAVSSADTGHTADVLRASVDSWYRLRVMPATATRQLDAAVERLEMVDCMVSPTDCAPLSVCTQVHSSRHVLPSACFGLISACLLFFRSCLKSSFDTCGFCDSLPGLLLSACALANSEFTPRHC